ncbi:MAG TPA: hypothetical protein VJS39_11875, partial [Gemmatimonadaceae bacterium]|nr:hypothetical protein [Gemmatimonadaceae bacterium]
MSPAELIVIGGGEHARVVADAARLSGAWNVLGFVDPVARPDTIDRGLNHLGDDEALRDHRRAHAILGFGGTEKGKARER